MRARIRPEVVGPLVGALGVPSVLVLIELVHVGDPVALVGLVTASAAINSLWPIGGGMFAQGTYRSRFLRSEWTHDGDRSRAESSIAGFVMALVTAGGFFVYLPILAEAWLHTPTRPSATVLTWVALGALLLGAGLKHRSEHAIYAWCERLDAGETIGAAELEGWVQALASIAKPSGAFGHTGGIGAFTVGLHEHLDAERILRAGAERQIAGATELHRRCLDYLATCALADGGFPAYPGGDARLEFTARAIAALGTRVSPPELARHRAFAERCRRGDRFARSERAEAEDSELRWGRAILSAPGA